MNPILSGAAVVGAIATIGGGAMTLDHLHVAADDFKKYIEQQQMADDRDYVLELKKDIRDIQGALVENPDEDYLNDALAELIDELCEIRPDDRLCENE
jgi:hypothetical protein